MSDERDTMPPGPPDPMMAICVRLEGKIDTLTNMVGAFFDELQNQKAALGKAEERIDFLERKGSGRPSENGHVDG